MKTTNEIDGAGAVLSTFGHGRRSPEPRGARLAWTEEASERLKTLWGEGKSAAVCAALMGVSRNSIIGRVHRMKLAKRGHAHGTDQSKVQRARRAREEARQAKRGASFAATIAKRKAGQAVAIAPPPPMSVPIPLAPPTSTPVGLMDLGPGFHQCRWPVGEVEGRDQLFCAAATGEEIYCAYHAALAKPNKASEAQRAVWAASPERHLTSRQQGKQRHPHGWQVG